MSAAERLAIRTLRRAGAAGGRRARIAQWVVFATAPRFTRPRALQRMCGTVEWRLTRPDGTASLYTMSFRNGRCTASRRVTADPDLTLKISTQDFLALALADAEPVSLAAHRPPARRGRPRSGLPAGPRLSRLIELSRSGAVAGASLTFAEAPNQDLSRLLSTEGLGAVR